MLAPATHLEFVNADLIAEERRPENPAAMSYEAAVVAAERRSELIARGLSFVAETVFSHRSESS